MVNQSNHRMAMERMVITGNTRRAYWGMVTGFLLGVLGLVIALWLGLAGHDWLAGTIGGATLVSLVSVFVLGTTSRRNERVEKAKNATQQRGRRPGQ